MTAKELKDKSIKSASKEISNLETLMNKAADKGDLFLIIGGISSAARSYFLSNGFEVKIMLDPSKEYKENEPKQWKILWEK